MKVEQPDKSTFWQRVRWDGCAPFVVLGTRGVLALCFGQMASAAIGSLLISPMVAMARAHIANQQIASIGARRVWTRQICIAAAIITIMLFEIVAMFLWAGGDASLEAWLFAAGLYLLYLVLIMTALRPAVSAKAADPYAKYWTVQSLDK